MAAAGTPADVLAVGDAADGADSVGADPVGAEPVGADEGGAEAVAGADGRLPAAVDAGALSDLYAKKPPVATPPRTRTPTTARTARFALLGWAGAGGAGGAGGCLNAPSGCPPILVGAEAGRSNDAGDSGERGGGLFGLPQMSRPKGSSGSCSSWRCSSVWGGGGQPPGGRAGSCPFAAA
ncbi:hypothetical protein [Nonomuraea rhodomycinica]|uniref:Uncharacterized protein n=1 Tax=Nonomuraea rhodomycinica TaxID=1712872 RepID=A0A7Y6MBQ0_9ACTN|nr:hypothetical protein [Nonomuraea rhodomycinica]NUW40714.1 hypothetical protein [Nonomuraea rhodomycinica]